MSKIDELIESYAPNGVRFEELKIKNYLSYIMGRAKIGYFYEDIGVIY